jgi:hypothetical protein
MLYALGKLLALAVEPDHPAFFLAVEPRLGRAWHRRSSLDGYADTKEEIRGLSGLDSVTRPKAGLGDSGGKPWTGLLLQRAGEGTRTLDIQLGKLALYQLSYARICQTMAQKAYCRPFWALS